jgi:hypothetical protein
MLRFVWIAAKSIMKLPWERSFYLVKSNAQVAHLLNLGMVNSNLYSKV